jgi:hypothetical protein
MPLRGEAETGLAEMDLASFAGPLQGMRAPWAGWFDRKRLRLRWLGFSQALAFYGLLRGLGVHYHNLPEAQGVFGVSDQECRAVCWLGAHEWQVSGAAGRELGQRLWRAFLDAGGPWPTEFHLRARPGGGLHPRSQQGFARQGPRCQQVWDLIEPRERPAWL